MSVYSLQSNFTILQTPGARVLPTSAVTWSGGQYASVVDGCPTNTLRRSISDTHVSGCFQCRLSIESRFAGGTEHLSMLWHRCHGTHAIVEQ